MQSDRFVTSFFRAYDLRGIHPDEIDAEIAHRIGRAYGSECVGSPVVVGRDGRTQAPEIARALIEGITATGTDVVDVGEVPTPLVRYASTRPEFAGAAMVTASHNPPEYIGVKFSTAEGVAMSRDGGMKAIQERYETGTFERGEGSLTERNLEAAYLDTLLAPLDGADLTVAVNFANGVAATVGRTLLERLGCTVIGINETIDGTFPAHPPVPDDPGAIKAVTDHLDGADAGICFDGDGDRMGLVLPERGAVPTDALMALFSRACLEREPGTVVHSLDTSQLVADVVDDHGGSTVETRVGFTYIAEEIDRRNDVVFAGEPSGHYGFPAFGINWDDGLFGAALACQLVSATDVTGWLAALPAYPTSPTHRIDCPEAAKQPAIEAIDEQFAEYPRSRVDGVKIRFADGWALVRPSNTEPKLSVRCEANTDATLAEIESEVLAAVDDAIDTVSQ